MEEKILNMLTEICGTDEVSKNRDIDLFEEELFDSLAITELLVQIEEEFGIEIAPTEITREDIKTPNKIIELVSKRG